MSVPAPGWAPKLVALDIDGTLLRWIEGAGQTHAEVSDAVADAVRRARAAGAHVVLASGRSPHGMTPVADMLGLDDPEDPVWVVASNGGVVFRYPPMDIVHEHTFDARPAVMAVLEEHPDALVGVEERGRGYRVNRPFPAGELSGDMIETPVEDIVAEPVSRVIIRDPQATAEDFVDLAGRLGLHGTDYVVGWTAWMDLSPVSPKPRGCSRSATTWASRRRTRWRSATAATTWRCSPGRAGPWRWARRSRRSAPPPTT